MLFEGMENISLDLEGYDQLAVYNLDYLKALMKLLAKTPKETICKYCVVILHPADDYI